MKQSERRSFGKALLCGAMCLTMTLLSLVTAVMATPMTAQADTLYDLWVGPYQFSDTMLEVNSATDAAFEGTASYDPGSNTLTLNGFKNNRKVRSSASYDAGIYYQGAEQLTINLIGSNIITTDNVSDKSVLAFLSPVTAPVVINEVSAGSELQLIAGNTSAGNAISSGIYQKGSLTIGSGAVTAMAGNATFSEGVSMSNGEGVLTVTGGSLVAKGGTGDYSDGIILKNGAFIKGGEVTAIGGTAKFSSVGITSENSGIEIVNGSLNATGGESGSSESCGAGVAAQVDVKGGSFVASGNDRAVYQKLKNAIPGTGWTNAAGTEGQEAIAVSDTARELTYKKVKFPADAVPTAPVITTTSLPDGAVNTAYSKTLTAESTSPVTWSLATGTLPTGLSINANGRISGTPTEAGLFSFTVKAANAAGEATKKLSVAVADAVSPDKIRAFVTRMYRVALGRDPDEKGLNSWTNDLKSGSKKGADIAQGFYMSPEIFSTNPTSEEYVELAYLGMMNRPSDAGGKADWVDALNNGVTCNAIIRGFVGSQEFHNLCADYGIQPGEVTVTEPRDQNVGVTKFVARLYTQALGRPYDVDGLNDWAAQINANPSKENILNISTNGFLNSQEFLSKGLSNEDFVRVLYRTFLGREADPDGMNDWLNRLNSGASRDEIAAGFAGSPEFAIIMANYGL